MAKPNQTAKTDRPSREEVEQEIQLAADHIDSLPEPDAEPKAEEPQAPEQSPKRKNLFARMLNTVLGRTSSQPYGVHRTIQRGPFRPDINADQFRTIERKIIGNGLGEELTEAESARIWKQFDKTMAHADRVMDQAMKGTDEVFKEMDNTFKELDRAVAAPHGKNYRKPTAEEAYQAATGQTKASKPTLIVIGKSGTYHKLPYSADKIGQYLAGTYWAYLPIQQNTICLIHPECKNYPKDFAPAEFKELNNLSFVKPSNLHVLRAGLNPLGRIITKSGIFYTSNPALLPAVLKPPFLRVPTQDEEWGTFVTYYDSRYYSEADVLSINLGPWVSDKDFNPATDISVNGAGKYQHIRTKIPHSFKNEQDQANMQATPAPETEENQIEKIVLAWAVQAHDLYHSTAKGGANEEIFDNTKYAYIMRYEDAEPVMAKGALSLTTKLVLEKVSTTDMLHLLNLDLIKPISEMQGSFAHMLTNRIGENLEPKDDVSPVFTREFFQKTNIWFIDPSAISKDIADKIRGIIDTLNEQQWQLMAKEKELERQRILMANIAQYYGRQFD